MQFHFTVQGDISRKRALVAVAIPTVMLIKSELTRMKLAHVATEMVEDRDERLRIYDETTKFLIDNANDRTLVELNEKLDFWRVVRGQEAVAQD